jgi:short-subunit dehydrogenase
MTKNHGLRDTMSKLSLYPYFLFQETKSRPVHSIYPAIDPSRLIAHQTFRGKCVVVTGASRGIGEDAARAFALAGASVVLVSRNENQLAVVETRIMEEVPKAQVLKIAMDVTDPIKAEAAVARTVEIFGGVDVLVAAAGRMRAMDGLCISIT